MVRIKVNDQWLTEVLIDSGASRSVIDANYSKRLGLAVRTLDENDPKFLLTANAQPVQCLGKVELNMCIQGLNVVHDFLVLPDLSNQLLVGTDFLIGKKCILNFEMQYLSVYGDLVRIQLERSFACQGVALLAKNTRVPPNAQMAVCVKLSEFSNDKILLLEPLCDRSRTNDNDLLVARTLIRSAGQKLCSVANLTNQTIFLRKNTPIATVSRVDDIVANLSATNENSAPPPIVNSNAPPGDQPKRHTCESMGIKIDNEELSEEQKQHFIDIIDKNGDCFALQNSEISANTVPLEFKITLKPDTKPVKNKSFQYSKFQREEIRRQVQELLDIKFIEPSTSEYSSNCLLVKKRDGTYRMVTDYRLLNKCIVQEVHGVPNYCDIYDALAESKADIFSVIDLKGSFHALPVEKNSQQYTAFTTGYGKKFNYLRAPYGISSIPSHLCRLMCYVLSVDDGPLYRFALSYLDDILLFFPVALTFMKNTCRKSLIA